MKVSKTISHRINMGNYESMTIGASVEVDTTEDEVSRIAALQEIDHTISESLEADLKQARRLAHEDSYVHDLGRN